MNRLLPSRKSIEPSILEIIDKDFPTSPPHLFSREDRIPGSNFEKLPTEIIQHLITFLPFRDAKNLGQTSQMMRFLSGPEYKKSMQRLIELRYQNALDDIASIKSVSELEHVFKTHLNSEGNIPFAKKLCNVMLVAAFSVVNNFKFENLASAYEFLTNYCEEFLPEKVSEVRRRSQAMTLTPRDRED